MLITDGKTCKLIGVSRETIEETLKSFNNAAKVLAKWSNAMWDILLASEVGRECPHHKIGEAANQVYGHPQEQDNASQIAHGYLQGPSGCLFSHYESVRDVTLDTRDFVFQVTVTHKNFLDIPYMLMCWGQNILFIVEGCKPPLLVLWCQDGRGNASTEVLFSEKLGGKQGGAGQDPICLFHQQDKNHWNMVRQKASTFLLLGLYHLSSSIYHKERRPSLRGNEYAV